MKDANGEPLVGVSVSIDGKAVTVTDIDGNYQLSEVPQGASISVNYIGFSKQTKTVSGGTLNFVMQEDSEFLEEAVVVGYGTVKKNDLTGSVGSVKTDKLTMKGAPTMMEALQGAVAGVNITQNSSRAGGGFNIDIRGRSSLNSGTTPMYVVDGVICDDIQWLNQQDIERIDILKDASSTAIYGSRATAGVVMVTTKGALAHSKGARPSISYDGYVGMAIPTRFPDFQDAEEFYTYRLRRFLSFAGETGSTAQPVYTMNASDFGQMALESTTGSGIYRLHEMRKEGINIDWPRLISQNGLQQNHYISVAGSSQDIRYHLGAGYTQQEGVYMGDNEQKFNFKGSMDAKINRFITAGFSINLAKIHNDYASDNGVSNAYRTNAFWKPYFEDGSLIPQPGCRYYIGTEGYQFSSGFNPLMYWDNEEKQKEAWRMMANAYLSIKPLKSLEFKTTFSPNYTGQTTGYYQKEVSENSYRPNSAYIQGSRGLSWTWDNVINWQQDFDDIHDINLMALASATYGQSESEKYQATDVMEGTLWYNLATGTYDANNSSNGYSESSMLSYALRANYTLLNKYLFTATVRWDGSSRFAEGYKWGSFPSAAFAWRLSEEDWLINLKLRAAYGITGNNSGIGNYATHLTVSGPNYYPYGNQFSNAYYPSGIVIQDLKWETSKETNLGLDYAFLENRIFGSIDWYNKISSDLLYKVDLPLVSGGVSMNTNVGSVLNRGIELQLTTVNIANNNWHWETTFSFAKNHNEVLDINGLGTDIIPTGITGGLFIGHPVENVYTYQWDGIVSDKMMTVPESELAIVHGFTPGEQIRECDYYYEIYKWQEGQPIIKDVNQDGIFDNNDKKIYSSAPKWTGSFSTSLSYKNWDLSASMYTKMGYYVSSNFYSSYYDLSDRGRMRLNADWYVPAGTLLDCDGVTADGMLINPVYQENTHYGSYPFPNAGTGDGAGIQADYWNSAKTIVDASFLKVKNITLGYTFSKSALDKIGCQALRLYLNVTNPFVFTNYGGFDPEWANASLSNDGPSTVTYQLGASLKF
ncbi:MAG: SusC/RagA family TonB-linked outer membrane protein [Bacteroidales bacterium]|nr:SusC/RagA family TonB-linked outer membrane protein [Bacteroidales bacterium]